VKRLGIFCFFDEDGVADLYVEYLIKDLKKVLDGLIVVVNGNINDEGRSMLGRYADKIIVRENVGFDFGAYVHVLVDVLERNELHKWDELVFCNDTFYGPFIPFRKIFASVEQKDTDFWGLNLVEDGFMTHIQSYFLVFGKAILESDVLFEYIDRQYKVLNLEEGCMEDVFAFFELGLFAYLKEKGFSYGAYTSTGIYDVYRNPEICIRKYSLPILKKKCFSDKYINMYDLPELLRYIDEDTDYDIGYIKQSIQRKYGDIINKDAYTLLHPLVGREDIVDFINNHSDIYIYGTGVYARKIWLLFHERIKNFKGFIVSDNQNNKLDSLYGYEVKYYSDTESGSAFIIGCDHTNTKSIMGNVKDMDSAFCIWKDKDIFD
jgi:hypothetical protein